MAERHLAIRVDNWLMTPSNVGEAIEIAKMIASSGMVPKQYAGEPGAVLVALQMGAELGLAPMQALQNIAVINGRPSLWGDAMLALVISHPDCESVNEFETEDGFHCRVQRRGRAAIERVFSEADAKRAGLLGKQGPWQQYPKRMLQLRARGFALRDSFPDVLRGIRTTEETLDIVESEFEEARRNDPLAEGTHSVRKTQPEAQSETPPVNPAHGPAPVVEASFVEPEPEPEPEPAPKPEPKPVPKAKAKTPKSEPKSKPKPKPEQGPAQGALVPDLGPAESEYYTSIQRSETMSELDVLTEYIGRAKMRDRARSALMDEIAKKRAQLMLTGKPEPGADG